jgi:hypothetical protein
MDIEQFYINRISQLLNIIATLNSENHSLKESIKENDKYIAQCNQKESRKEHDGAPCVDDAHKAGGSE